jgi:hypothetical protein
MFNSVSLMLGGKPSEVRNETGKWRITKREFEAVIEFAEESQRFISRVTREESSTAPSTAAKIRHQHHQVVGDRATA